jgi:hypothetical protein
MMFRKLTSFLLPMALLCVAANADTVFNFDSDAPGTLTTFTDTVNGVSATFSSLADPGGFVIFPSMFETLTGNVLGDPGTSVVSTNIALNVDFSQNLGSIALDFATADFGTPSPLTLTAYENSTLVGSATSTGTFLAGFEFPEGIISFNGGTFNNVVLISTAPDFAVDNIAVTPTPEPKSLSLLTVGLLLAAIIFVRRRKAVHA